MPNGKPLNKLGLSKETLRLLQDGQLEKVAGGFALTQWPDFLCKPSYQPSCLCKPQD